MPLERLRRHSIGSTPFINGIDLRPLEEDAGHSFIFLSRNMYPRRLGGLIRRDGIARHTASPIPGAIGCVGLTRWRDASGTIWTIAIFSFSGGFDKIYRISDVGAATEITGGSSLVTKAGQVYSFLESPLDSGMGTGNDALLFANGASQIQAISATLLSKSDVSGAPVGAYLALYNGSLLVSGITSQPGVVRYSAPLNFTSWPAVNGLVVDAPGETLITGIISGEAGTDLAGSSRWFLAFTREKVYIYRGDLVLFPTVFGSLSVLMHWSGCPSPRSIIHTPHGILFVSKRGPYIVTPNQQAIFICHQIETLFTGLRDDLADITVTRASNNAIYAAYHNGFVRIGMPASGNSVVSQEFWVDLRAFPDRVAWFGPMSVVGHSIIAATGFDSERNRIFGGEAETGFVNELDIGDLDISARIPFSLVTMRIADLPDADRDKIKIFKAVCVSVRSGTENTVQCKATVDSKRSLKQFGPIIESGGVLWDGGSDWDDTEDILWDTETDVFNQLMFRMDSHMRGRFIQIELNDGEVYNQAVEIDNISILYIPVPRLIDGYDAQTGIVVIEAA